MKQPGIAATSLFFLLLVGAFSVQADQQEKIDKFILSAQPTVDRSANAAAERPLVGPVPSGGRRSVGSVLSTEDGIGVGTSVARTYDDSFYHRGRGRHVRHWWNGEYGGSTELSVHFGYRLDLDPVQTAFNATSGHQIYDATVGDWPMLMEIGCLPPTSGPSAWGNLTGLDIMSNGRAVMVASVSLEGDTIAGGARYIDNMLFYQDTEFGCNYGPGLNTTFIDSLSYRPLTLNQASGKYTQDPQIATQWDGANTIVHLILAEQTPGTSAPVSDHYVSGLEYRTALYYRKVGDAASANSWSSGQVIDTCWFPWFSLAAAPYPNEQVAVTYTNPSYYGALLNNEYDLDVWHRESLDRGLTWQPSSSITEYNNAIEGDPNHYAAWLESQCLYTTDGDFHVVWTAKETSADPYFDGFNWQDFHNNVYHWSRATDATTKVANGSFQEWIDFLHGSFNTYHCGFGGVNVGYLGNVNISECDDKLYCVWNQIHERANRFPWRDANYYPVPGVIDDCAYTGERMAMANWEILMSVTTLAESNRWDMPRNITNTYTPDCGAPGDPEGAMLCGSEYKPSVEKYGLDESGLTPVWPAEATVDLSPPAVPFTGSSYLHMSYMDDQFPGPNAWSQWTTDPRTYNSVKWVRLACVEPVYAAYIEASEENLQWPRWVETGTVNYIPIMVYNTGNERLEITEIILVEDGPATGWLSLPIGPTVQDPFVVPVTGQVVNFGWFDIVVNTTGFSQPTWLDGSITLISNAANYPSLELDIHLLAADHVEPVIWDTVMSHENMFSPFFPTAGECVALSVGNNGEMGMSAKSSGSVNLDYVESELECGERDADGFYLAGGSAFVIVANDSEGSGARLTQSAFDLNYADPTNWNPTNAKGSMQWGNHLSPGGDYDSAYTGQFVNSDTTIAMERWYYTPRSHDPANRTINYVISVTKVYSADGNPHNHVTIGDVIDWNVPSDSVNMNRAGLGSDFVYIRGTDTVGSTSCQSNTGRTATQAFGGSFSAPDFCGTQDDMGYHSINALNQAIMLDTTHDRSGNPLTPSQPIPQVWWDETSISGVNANTEIQDQAVWLTFKHDYDLAADDTLYYWTVLTTTRDESPAALEAHVTYAQVCFQESVYECSVCGSCCLPPMVGDANNDGANMPTVGDISIMIDAKFVTGSCDGVIPCLEEADINLSASIAGSPNCDDITIGDISMLIDYLFITGPAVWDIGYGPGMLPPCGCGY